MVKKIGIIDLEFGKTMYCDDQFGAFGNSYS